MKYRKKPVVIEAFRMTKERRWDNSEWPEWLNEAWQIGPRTGGMWPNDYDTVGGSLLLGTREGTHLVKWGEWIIRGVAGELYNCNPEIFAQTYEPATTVEKTP